jgi:hypothetical protein
LFVWTRLADTLACLWSQVDLKYLLICSLLVPINDLLMMLIFFICVRFWFSVAFHKNQFLMISSISISFCTMDYPCSP